MKVTYIGHSGFMLEMEKSCFLFDYYYGTIPVIDPEKSLYVFASHVHGDHYNSEILKLADQYEKCRFILSFDIEPRLAGFAKKDQVTFVKPGDVVTLDELVLKIYDSTDLGVSFAVFAEGKSIFHAGDLHWWTWIGEETEEEYEEMTRLYKEEIEKVRDDSYNVAFYPLDPRQGEREDWGMRYFLDHVQAGKVFPMHCQGEYDIIPRYLKKYPNDAEKIVAIHKEGEEILL